MSTRAASWLAWSLAALCVAIFVALGVLARSAQSPNNWVTVRTVSDMLRLRDLPDLPPGGSSDSLQAS